MGSGTALNFEQLENFQDSLESELERPFDLSREGAEGSLFNRAREVLFEQVWMLK